jgi:hypothetical protein
MPQCNAEALALDHVHCRAICDEIGERFRQVLKPETLEIPQRLLARLAELEQAPSIVPSMDDMYFMRFPESPARITRSADRALPATSRK